VGEILDEWIAWRQECVKRRVYFDLQKKKEKLHLLYGLKKILLDIDRAIAIIRGTEHESDVVPNLMIGFGIDQIQADFVAEIRLRNINREYILKRVEETEELEKQIADLELTLNSRRRIKNIIISELEQVMKKYPSPRRSVITYDADFTQPEEEDHVPDYPVHLFLSREGYFKKITPQSLRMSAEQKYKENDGPAQRFETTNRAELLVFTDRQQVYKTRAGAFDDTKASVLGDFVPVKLGFDEGERVVRMVATTDYSGFLLFCFENGKVAKVPLSAYQTKTNRKKLANAYSAKNPIVEILYIRDDCGILLRSTNNRALMFNSAMLLPKSTRDSIGVQVMTLRAKAKLESAAEVPESRVAELQKYAAKNIPASGGMAKDMELSGQMTL
jgi:DNA gyrase subunit A